APRVSIADGLADARKRLEQLWSVQWLFYSFLPTAVVICDGVRQRVPSHEAHGVEGLPVFRPPGSLVNRDDIRVLQLARDLRLFQEPLPHLWVLNLIRPDFFQGYVAV